MERWTGGTDELAEHGCYICGNRDNLLSTEVIIDTEGILALCSGCVVTLAKFGGYRLWSPEMEAEFEHYKVRARDAEHYQRVAEDAVIKLVEAGTEINARREDEKALLAERLGERDSAGRFVSKSSPLQVGQVVATDV